MSDGNDHKVLDGELLDCDARDNFRPQELGVLGTDRRERANELGQSKANAQVPSTKPTGMREQKR